MNSTETDFARVASAWQEATLLYPLYSALSREFVFEVAPCMVLESGIDVPDQETVDEAREWLALLDGRTQVHQLRQFLQTTSLADEVRVRARYCGGIWASRSRRIRIATRLIFCWCNSFHLPRLRS